MFTLKPISRDSVDGALAKAERYRLLNEPQRSREHLPRHPRSRPGEPARRASA